MQSLLRPSAEPPTDAELLDAGDAPAWRQAWLSRSMVGHFDGMAYRCRADLEGTVEYVSEGALALTGYRADILVSSQSLAFAVLVKGEDRERRRIAMAQAAQSLGRYALEYRMVRADGSTCWVSERGIALAEHGDGVSAYEGFIEDITERKHAELTLSQAEECYRSMFDSALEGIFRSSPDGHYLVVNSALARIYGYDSAQELLGAITNIGEQLYVDRDSHAEFRQRIERDGEVAGFEHQAYKKNGETVWVSVNARAKRDARGKLVYFEGSIEDVTERRRYQERIEHQANYDALTGLANRSLLNERLTEAVSAAESGSGGVAVAFVDLDQFKFINDSFGHQLGDALLQTMAERLKDCVREGDTVARQGGDEFVLVLRNYDQEDEVTRIVQRIQSVIGEVWSAGRREFHVTCSIGVAVYPQDGGSADVLLRSADSAMYKAKENGRDTFQFYTAELNRSMVERLSIEHKLRGALARKQFQLHYQPRINMRTGRIVGAEALLRWYVADGDLYPPSRFISVAEDTGLIVPIGKWALQTACDQARSWQIQGLAPMVVSVNVSPRQFREGNIVETVSHALEQSGLPARYLQLELTESMVMHDPESAVSMLRDLKALGVQMAVDDFGTGYSSLSYLKRFPVDHLKIDRSFVKDIASDPDDAAIVQAIIALGHKLGLKVVAEGVETEEQQEFLRRNRCNEMQGFLFCKPLPAAEFAAMLGEHSMQLMNSR